MCGISGWQAQNSWVERLVAGANSFTSSMHHRGPDSTGHFFSDDRRVYLGHNRLSIIDLSDAGNQPMYFKDASGEIIITMVLNGEIYNYQDLKKILIAKGYQFSSQSDSEVALKSYLEWGIECVSKLKGMFALSIWDERSQTMHLVRDPMGIKPLYYWQTNDQKAVIFASEIRAFTEFEFFDADINNNSIQQFLEFGYTFNPVETIFSRVKKLQPGHRLEVTNGVATHQIRFFSPDTTNNFLANSNSSEETEELLYEQLKKVTHQHLIADVPLGLLLSGGLDSSLIAAIAAQKEHINTFSMGFADSQVDERPFARLVSDHIGSTHKEILIEPHEILDNIESVAGHYDDIFADWGMISTRILYKKCAHENIKVVLVGEGSDELFGGYSVFKESLRRQNAPMEWRIFQLYRRYAGRRYGGQYRQFRKIIKGYLSDCNNDLFAAIRLFETRNQVPNNYVMKVDKASMSLSLEARTPFLDSRIAELAYQIPKELLINHSDEKLILKSIAKRYKLLPDEILNRRKFGAGIASNWIEDSPSFRQYASEIILAKDSWVDDLNLRGAMHRYLVKGETGYSAPRSISIFRNLAWRLLILNLWSKSLGLAN
jgi:asparagine synthase (glutamine-hydrolysing)